MKDSNTAAAPVASDVRRLCGWCGGFLGGNPNGHIVSHGICKPCSADFLNGKKPAKIKPHCEQVNDSCVFPDCLKHGCVGKEGA